MKVGEKCECGFYYETMVFYPKISASVQNGFEDKVSIVKLENTEIIEKCVIAVSMYRRLEDEPKNMGGAQFVGEPF